jgi:hypothetical protein
MIRNIFQYTADAMESFGIEVKNILGRDALDFKIREWPWESRMINEKKRLEGQELALEQFYRQMTLFGRREYANRMFVFRGPPGSGKTLLNETLDSMLEHYSERNPKGALYRLIWVFSPQDGSTKLGFPIPRDKSSLLQEEESQDGVRLVYRPPGNTDPLFFLQSTSDGNGPREKLLTDLERKGQLPQDLNRDYFLRGKLDTFSEEVLTELRRYYLEEFRHQPAGEKRNVIETILNNHVRVERYTLSRRHGRGICSIWATPNRNADLEQLASSFAPLPGELQSAERELYRPMSLMIDANRGHLHFSDLFRPDERDRGGGDTSHLNHLLNEIESGEHQIMSLRQAAKLRTERINVLLRADANDNLVALKAQGQGWDSLRRRIEFIPVPHITRFLSEAAAQEDFFKTVVGRSRSISPHVLETFSLFTTSTRLLKPEPSHYETVHEQLPKILRSMSIVEKALLMQEPRGAVRIELNMIKQEESDRWSQDELELIRAFLPRIVAEHSPITEESINSFYDGSFGISTASAQDFLRKIATYKTHEPISLVEVIAVLRDQLGQFSYYEKIQELKHQLIQRLAEQRVKEAEKDGKSLDTAKLTKEIGVYVERLYPIPSPETIIDEVERYAKRCVQDDLYFALGLASDENSALSIRRYLEHARVSVGQPPLEVKPFYRVSSQESGANEKLLQDFEDRVVKNVDLSSAPKRIAYRQHLFEQIGNWQAANPHGNVLNNYEVIFGELVQGIRVVQKESLEKPLNDFRMLLEEYAQEPTKIQQDMDAGGESREHAIQWSRALNALEEKLGYPKEAGWLTIRKSLEWALKK